MENGPESKQSSTGPFLFCLTANTRLVTKDFLGLF
jgi:hypothetical protein